MVYGSGQRKQSKSRGGGAKFVVCVLLALAAFVIKTFYPDALNSEQLSTFLSDDWDITSISNLVTKPWEIKQLAIDIFNAVFGKEDKPVIKEEPIDDLTLSTLYLRSYGVSDYLSMAGISQAITLPKPAQYIMPAYGKITSLYGWREHPITGESSFHTGVDIALNVGEQVCAVSDAVVEDLGVDSIYGNYIVLTHCDGSQSFYAHLENVFVSRGQPVSSGQCIGHSGSTGHVTGPHLHFELRKDGGSVDPMEYIGEAA